jgi:hypothetical protein
VYSTDHPEYNTTVVYPLILVRLPRRSTFEYHRSTFEYHRSTFEYRRSTFEYQWSCVVRLVLTARVALEAVRALCAARALATDWHSSTGVRACVRVACSSKQTLWLPIVRSEVQRAPCRICAGTGLAPSFPHLHRDWARPFLPTSAPGLGLPPATSAPGLSSPLPTSAPGLGSPPATSAPGLGSPLSTYTPGLRTARAPCAPLHSCCRPSP